MKRKYLQLILGAVLFELGCWLLALSLDVPPGKAGTGFLLFSNGLVLLPCGGTMMIHYFLKDL
jgi:hypothetical protein